MPNVDALPELKQILGALIFGSARPLTLRELRNCVIEVAESDASVEVYANTSPTAAAAPVLVGIIEWVAERARRRSE